MKRPSVTGSGDAVAMVWTPEPGIANSMMSNPGAALESRIACRSDPGPESFTLVTVCVAAEAPRAAANTGRQTPNRIAGTRRLCIEFPSAPHAQTGGGRDHAPALTGT